LKEAGGRRPPRLLEILPLSATDGCVDGSFPAESPSRALGIQGEGKGVRPKASQSAKDFLIELPERDSRSILKMPSLKEMNRCMCAKPTSPHTPSLFMTWPSSAAC